MQGTWKKSIISEPKEFSMPTIKRLRELYQKVADDSCPLVRWRMPVSGSIDEGLR